MKKHEELIRIYADFIVANAFDEILQNDSEDNSPVFIAWHGQSPGECQRITNKLTKIVIEQLGYFEALVQKNVL